jgi:hypothetical protein
MRQRSLNWSESDIRDSTTDAINRYIRPFVMQILLLLVARSSLLPDVESHMYSALFQLAQILLNGHPVPGTRPGYLQEVKQLLRHYNGNHSMKRKD